MAKQAINQYMPDYIVSPGEVLEFELQIRGMTQNELAKRTGLTPKHIGAIVNAKSAITPETAIKLERAIGMPVQYWLNLRTQYQEALARSEEHKELKPQSHHTRSLLGCDAANGKQAASIAPRLTKLIFGKH